MLSTLNKAYLSKTLFTMNCHAENGKNNLKGNHLQRITIFSSLSLFFFLFEFVCCYPTILILK